MTEPPDAASLHRLWAFTWEQLDGLATPFGYNASDGGGLYPALFGRDSLWVVLLLLEAIDPTDATDLGPRVGEAAQRVLLSLAERQATEVDDRVEAQPGKIPHVHLPGSERLPGDDALPLVGGTSYCGFDQTFLFTIAACRFLVAYPTTTARAALEAAVEAAVSWILDVAVESPRGLAAYRRRDPANPVHQVWKDSFDSITHAGFDVPPPPVAWIEVQAYAWAALTEAAELGIRPGEARRGAERVRAETEGRLWWPEEGTYAVASDGTDHPVRMVTSNAGHALWAGMADPDRARSVTARLSRPDMLTDHGLRTLSADDRFFEVSAYHRGTVWPFDNAVAASGMLRYGQVDAAVELACRVTRALEVIGSPIELYGVVPAAALLAPPARVVEASELVFHRRTPPQNVVQAFSAAGLIWLTALLADHTAVPLPGRALRPRPGHEQRPLGSLDASVTETRRPEGD